MSNEIINTIMRGKNKDLEGVIDYLNFALESGLLSQDLDEDEESDYRKWAQNNFEPYQDKIVSVWHPVVKDECMRMCDGYIIDEAKRERVRQRVRSLLEKRGYDNSLTATE